MDHTAPSLLDPNKKNLLKGAGVSAGIITAPYLLPAVGIGSDFVTNQLLNFCSTAPGLGSGLTGIINKGLSAIPEIGTTLAAGGWINAAASGVVGIGGVLLGNYIQKHYDRDGQIPWGKIIKYAALATSLLIALPSILSGLTIGLTFMASLTGSAVFTGQVAGALSSTLGLMGNINLATMGAGIASLLPHLMTCGAALLPAMGALMLDKPHTKVEQPRHVAPMVQPAATRYALSA